MTRYELESLHFQTPDAARREALEFDANVDAEYRREAFAGMIDENEWFHYEAEEEMRQEIMDAQGFTTDEEVEAFLAAENAAWEATKAAEAAAKAAARKAQEDAGEIPF